MAKPVDARSIGKTGRYPFSEIRLLDYDKVTAAETEFEFMEDR
jgi:hypothetical protein